MGRYSIALFAGFLMFLALPSYPDAEGVSGPRGGTTCWPDTDDDGFGDSDSPPVACGPFTAENDLDCDDTNPSIYPDSTEVVVGNEIDENCSSGLECWVDLDDDLFGSTDWSDGWASCAEPGASENNADCNDFDPDINPAEAEIFGDKSDTDENCSGTVGCWEDVDKDGYGAGLPQDVYSMCTVPGASYNADDCDDTDPEISPDTVWYNDSDGDGYGDSLDAGTMQCVAPTKAHVLNNFDCNDGDPTINPDTTWYPDNDGDEYGDSNDPGVVQCEAPKGYILDNNDCNDSDPEINPLTMWYTDNDADGYGVPPSFMQCQQPKGTAFDDGDCNDGDPDINPGAFDDPIDDLDSNCDGWDYDGSADTDGDGYSDRQEDLNQDGNVDDDNTDGDVFPDYNDTDDDNDTIPTIDEIDEDRDKDKLPNYLDEDDDNDTVPTASEDVDPVDGDPTNDNTDGDKYENYRDPDDDNDGIPTIEEDANMNGDPTDDDSDGDGIPDYLDDEEEDVFNHGFENLPVCA